jgi:hypothetical protein
MAQEREEELRNKIAVKRKEQYLATRDIINKANDRVCNVEQQLKMKDLSHSTKIRLQNDKDMYSRNRDIIYGIADRNRCIYEYEIDRINVEIKLLYEKDPERIREINEESKLKTAYYELIGDHTGRPDDVRRHIYKRILSPTGEYKLGLLELTRTHMRDSPLCEYEMDNVTKIYRRALYLYDLGLKDCIMDFYKLAETLPKSGAIAEFVEKCATLYVIPDKLRRYRLRAKMFTQLPLCQDVVCEIFSFINDEKLCNRRMIDTVVYAC